MAKSVQIASVFTAIGFKVDKRDLDRLQKQLGRLKKDLRSFRNLAKINVETNLGGLKAARTQLVGINAELAKIKNKAIRVGVQRSSVDAGGGSRRTGTSVGRGAFGGSAIGSQLGQFGAGVGVTGALAFGGFSLLQTGQRLEAVRAGLTAAAGSAKAGAEEFKFMVDLSQRLGINFEDNVRSYQNFVAAARSLNFGTEKTRSVFSATASAARVLGLSAADTNGVMRAMTQILSKGTVQSEELRGQLGERMPGAVGMMAKAIGVSVEELNKMLEQGEVISKDALPKLADAMIDFANTAGALDKAVNSNLANQERLSNAWYFFKANIAESGFMDAMTEIFVDLAKVIGGNSKAASNFGAIFTGIALVLKSTLNVVSNFTIAVSEMSTGFKVALAALVFMLLPFSYWALAIVTVIGFLEELFALLRGEENLISDYIEKVGFWGKALTALGAILLTLLGYRKLSSLFSGTPKVVSNLAKVKASVGSLRGSISKLSGALRVAGGLGAAFGAGWTIGEIANSVMSQDLKDDIGQMTALVLANLGVDSAQQAVASTRAFRAYEQSAMTARNQAAETALANEMRVKIEASPEFKASLEDMRSNNPTGIPDL